MRPLLRISLVFLMVVALIDLPVLGAPTKALGLVVQAQNAQMGEVAAVSGATVYSGDSLATDSGGSLRLRVGAAQVYLLSSSAATLGDVPSGASATLTRGTAGFSTSDAGAIELRTPHAVVRAKTSQATHGRVTITGPNELLVTSFRGSLELDGDGETFTIAEGQTYRVVSEPGTDEPSGQDQGSSPKPAKRRHTALVLTALVAAQVGVTLGLIEVFESGDKPKQ